jgi:hypothetical protein
VARELGSTDRLGALERRVREMREVVDRFELLWPVNAIFLSVINTNPAALLGFGTWTSMAAMPDLAGYVWKRTG